MTPAVPIAWYLILAAFLFSTGVAAFLLKRNIITIFMSVELNTGAATTYLVGHPAYTDRIVREYIPSAFGADLVSNPDPVRVGLQRVEWKTGPLPKVAPGSMADWLSYNITKSASSAPSAHCRSTVHAPVHARRQSRISRAPPGATASPSGTPPLTTTSVTGVSKRILQARVLAPSTEKRACRSPDLVML